MAAAANNKFVQAEWPTCPDGVRAVFAAAIGDDLTAEEHKRAFDTWAWKLQSYAWDCWRIRWYIRSGYATTNGEMTARSVRARLEIAMGAVPVSVIHLPLGSLSDH